MLSQCLDCCHAFTSVSHGLYQTTLHEHCGNVALCFLQASLVQTSTARPRNHEEEIDSDEAPKRSPKEVASLEKERQQQKLSCLEELLAVTADMPEMELPMSQADIVLELASFSVVEPLLGCMDIRESAEARLQSAGVPPGCSTHHHALLFFLPFCFSVFSLSCVPDIFAD